MNGGKCAFPTCENPNNPGFQFCSKTCGFLNGKLTKPYCPRCNLVAPGVRARGAFLFLIQKKYYKNRVTNGRASCLLGRERGGKYYKHQYNLLGGGVHHGECPGCAAIREGAKEEGKFPASLIKPTGIQIWKGTTVIFVVIVPNDFNIRRCQAAMDAAIQDPGLDWDEKEMDDMTRVYIDDCSSVNGERFPLAISSFADSVIKRVRNYI